MDQASEFALSSMKGRIIKDLMPKYILQELVDWKVITGSQRAKIVKEVTEEKQAELLLNFIRKGSVDTFELFKKSLRTENIYFWLADALHATQERFTAFVEDQFRPMLTQGGVPQLPPHMFRRKGLELKLQKQLKEMFDNTKSTGLSKWVATWGMAGEGKTVLMASVLRDPVFLCDLGIEHVFWMKIGNRVADDTLLIKMHTLCEKMDEKYIDKGPLDLEMATHRLRGQFSTKRYKESLLVLDDVWEETVIRHFDFGVRILLSTRDRGIMEVATGDKEYVEIKNGFSQQDTLKFFSKSLNVDEAQLPQRHLGEICKIVRGNTFVLATICSVVRQYKKDIDKACLKCLENLRKDSASPFINTSKMSQYDYGSFSIAFKMSYDNLTPLDKDLYTDLAIFPADVYVSSRTLSILWQRDTFEVDEIMSSFVDKSIADQVQNGGKYNLYNIHDLCSQFLRQDQKNAFPLRHKRLVELYLNSCENKFENLPNDGYILIYLGHHLSEARMFDRMADVFLNLKALILKLKAVGPADLLGDFSRYREHIVQGGKFSKELEDFENFVRQDFLYLSLGNIDKVQIALSQPIESNVYKQAVAIARERPEKPYILWNNKNKIKSSSIINTRLHHGSVRCATFSSDGRFVISAGEDKLIIIWDSNSGQEAVLLMEHAAKVNHLCSFFNEDARQEVILSCSDDCTVKVWHVALRDRRATNLISKIRSVLSFTNHLEGVTCCSIARNGDLVASIDITGVIKVWNTSSGVETASWHGRHQDNRISCFCDFSEDGGLLVSIVGYFLQLWNVKKRLPEWELEERVNCFTSCLFSSDTSKVFATLDSSLVCYAVNNGTVLFRLEEPNSLLLMRCATSRDGRFVAASTSRNSVIVWSCDSRQIVAYHVGHKGNLVRGVSFELPTNVDDGDSYRLVSCDDKGGVIIWKGSYEEGEMMPLLNQVFSVQFDNQENPCIAAISMNNKIKVFNGMGDIISTQNGSSLSSTKITCCALSPGRDKVLYGTSAGSLMIFATGSSIATLAPMSPNNLKSVVCHCLFGRRDDVMVAAYESGEIIISRGSAAPIVFKGHGSIITSLKLFHNDQYLVSCSFDETVKVWNMLDGGLQFSGIGHRESVVCCDVNREDNLIASGSVNGILIVWDADQGAKLVSLTSSTKGVRACKFSAGHDFLATGDDEGRVQLWRLEHRCLSRNKKFAHVGASSSVVLHVIDTLRAGSSSSWVNDLAFSPDGLQLITCSETVRWWSLATYLKENWLAEQRKITDSAPDGTELLVKSYPDQEFFVKGSYVRKIFCARDFSSFVTVDGTGVMYHLRRLPIDSGTRMSHL